MLPFLLLAAGGYLIGSAMKDSQFASGGEIDYPNVDRFIELQIRANKELKENGSISERTADELNEAVDALNSHEAEIAIERFSELERQGKTYGEGGSIEEQNNRMLMSNVKEIKHHAEELGNIVKPGTEVDAWVVAKAERSASDLSDITHYLDGRQ